jgi:hypothetical protein
LYHFERSIELAHSILLVKYGLFLQFDQQIFKPKQLPAYDCIKEMVQIAVREKSTELKLDASQLSHKNHSLFSLSDESLHTFITGNCLFQRDSSSRVILSPLMKQRTVVMTNEEMVMFMLSARAERSILTSLCETRKYSNRSLKLCQ